MRERKRPILTMIAGVAVLATTGIAGAQLRAPMVAPFDGERNLFDIGIPGGWGARDGVGPGIQAAADHIISQQCGVGGWCWPHGIACCPTAPTNITAPIALGLLRAYDVTGDAASLASATLGGDYDLTVTFPNLTPAFGSFEPGFLHLLSDPAYSNNPAYSNHAATGFFDPLTAGTYGDPSVPLGSYYPADTYGYLARHKAARSGGIINLRPWDMQYMPWVAGLIGNPHSSGTDGVTQQDTFLNDAVLDGLDTLDSSLAYDLIGLAGGIRGLALNGTTTFPAISSPAFTAINGITDLCDLADVLVSYQNDDGSWSWTSSLQNPVDQTDKDTQTTAYAVLALVAADQAGCTPLPGGRYNAEIAAGRAFLDLMQDVDGGFFGYPGDTGHNTEVEGEATSAMAIAPLSLNTTVCTTTGTIVVDIDMGTMPDVIVGGQFFLNYNTSVLTFSSADPGDSPFTIEVFEAVNAGAGTITYAVGIPNGGSGTAGPRTMARITFTATGGCALSSLVTWDRTHLPPTRLTNSDGDEFLPTLEDLGEITIDLVPPVITCPANVTIECDESSDPSNTGTATATDNCDSSPDITYSDVITPGTCDDDWTITRTWVAEDDCGNTDSCDQVITVQDTTAPVVTCPADITVNADAPGCTASISVGTATTTDNCDPAPVVTGVRSDAPALLTDPYPAGVTTITWTATDDCGNSDSCDQIITVNGVNELVVNVELDSVGPLPGSFTRCITFELFDTCVPLVSVEVDRDITFDINGLATGAVVEVPCGDYVCITARDKLHTLRRTDDDGDFGVSGIQYVADFTSTGTTDDSLLGGNHNDDRWIDILDYGMFVGQWSVNYGTADTPCGTLPPHTDSSCNGVVDVPDFTFIQTQFLDAREPDCCGTLMPMVGRRPFAQSFDGPITRISVQELRRRGLHDLIVADLNHDGWLDVQDMAAFANGARP